MVEYAEHNVIKLVQNEAQNDNGPVQTNVFSLRYYLKMCFWDKFFCFKGRARRKEYLAFQCADFLVAALFYLMLKYTHASFLDTVYTAINIILIVPLLSVTVRRLHDIGLSAWWCALGVVPYAGLILLATINSQNKANKYGDVPEGKVFKANGVSFRLLRGGRDNVEDLKSKKSSSKTKRTAA